MEGKKPNDFPHKQHISQYRLRAMASRPEAVPVFVADCGRSSHTRAGAGVDFHLDLAGCTGQLAHQQMPNARAQLMSGVILPYCQCVSELHPVPPNRCLTMPESGRSYRGS